MNNNTSNVPASLAGEFDPSFNNGEILLLQGRSANDVAIGSSGTLYIVGGTTLAINSQYLISAFNSDGTPDQNFNSGEPVIDSFIPGAYSLAEQVSELPEGKILVVGVTGLTSSSRFGVALARYMPDGKLDLSYGVNGHVVPTHEEFEDMTMVRTDSVDDQSTSVYLDTGLLSLYLHHGLTYVAGFALKKGKGVTLLICLNDSGDLVQTFGNKGVSIIEHPRRPQNIHLNARGLLVTDSHIYLAGYIQINGRNHMAWVRVQPNGLLDLSFGSNGFVFDKEYPVKGNINAIAERDSLRLLGIGSGNSAMTRFQYHAMLVGIEKNGKYDLNFNHGEPILKTIPEKSSWHFGVIQPDGRIVACGSCGLDREYLIVGRCLPNGASDDSFGSHNGWIKLRMKDELLDSRLAVQPDNAIVIVGRYTEDRYAIPFALRLKG
ncbi:hypothetical protein CD58_10315 [Pseudomonas brassicacearum]|uniref:delta-60 repeat domain-containing protein n=1 Tax=Pseudomonas brassicacearum TaxID=930166 RepID=UPI00042E9E44|nr:delta-60 repeat domain-containing protein [Pseudomonas brassicacearum]AHL36856.1 hypothetical protein CD58_10315 [Pseudomonas brassicacearum]